jgi:hypothetical protein
MYGAGQAISSVPVVCVHNSFPLNPFVALGIEVTATLSPLQGF